MQHLACLFWRRIFTGGVSYSVLTLRMLSRSFDDASCDRIRPFPSQVSLDQGIERILCARELTEMRFIHQEARQ